MDIDLLAFSNPGVAHGIAFDSLTNYSSLALGLTSPDLPSVAGAATSTFQILNSNNLGYILFGFSLSALALLLYFSGQKKDIIRNELSQK